MALKKLYKFSFDAAFIDNFFSTYAESQQYPSEFDYGKDRSLRFDLTRINLTSQGTHHYLSCLDEKEPIGFVTIQLFGFGLSRQAVLENLVILPEHRGKGLGAMTLRSALKASFALGSKRTFASVFKDKNPISFGLFDSILMKNRFIKLRRRSTLERDYIPPVSSFLEIAARPFSKIFGFAVTKYNCLHYLNTRAIVSPTLILSGKRIEILSVINTYMTECFVPNRLRKKIEPYADSTGFHEVYRTIFDIAVTEYK